MPALPAQPSAIASTLLLLAASLGLAASACASSAAPPVTAAVSVPAAAVAAPQVDPHLEVLWKQRLGSRQFPQVRSIATNAAGDVIFATDTQDGAFLFRLDATPRLLWRTLLSAVGVVAEDVALDGEGNAYVTGWSRSSLVLGGKLVSAQQKSGFLLKLDGEGKKVWANGMSGEDVTVPSMFLSPKGEMFLAASFGGNMRVGAVTLSAGETPESEPKSLFAAQLTTAGSARWARELGARGIVTNLAQDGAGQVLVSGMFWGLASFNPSAPMRVEKAQVDGSDSFLVKLHASGKIRWARHMDVQRIVPVPDTSGDAYLCTGLWTLAPATGPDGSGPRAAQPAVFVKIAADGRVLFKLSLDAKVGSMSCDDVAVDDKGHAYVVGTRFSDERDPNTGGTSLVPRILKIDGNGNVVSTLDLRASFTTMASPRIVWSNGRLLGAGVTGTFADPSFFLAQLTL